MLFGLKVEQIAQEKQSKMRKIVKKQLRNQSFQEITKKYINKRSKVS